MLCVFESVQKYLPVSFVWMALTQGLIWAFAFSLRAATCSRLVDTTEQKTLTWESTAKQWQHVRAFVKCHPESGEIPEESFVHSLITFFLSHNS